MKGFFVLGLSAVVILFCFCSGYPFQASLRYAFHFYPAAIELYLYVQRLTFKAALFN